MESYCPASFCIDKSEVKSWECIGEHLFSYKNITSSSPTLFVEHNCGEIGWGNVIRGFFNTVSIALALGRKIVISSLVYDQMFTYPYKTNLAVSDLRYLQPFDSLRETFNFEQHAMMPGNFSKFIKSIKYDGTRVKSPYTRKVLNAGICSGVSAMFNENPCIDIYFPQFARCAKLRERELYMDSLMLNIPFFHTIFSKPSSTMAKAMKLIRKRLGLPMLSKDQESHPGVMGLRTPGYYIFSLHFRNCPMGFESMAAELNVEGVVSRRMTILEAFWEVAERYAAAAAEIARCRGLNLLIYFATDDTRRLRPIAKSKLSGFGRVVFGLEDDEVGHVYPQWREHELEEIENKSNKDMSPEALQMRSNMAIAEW
mmetsp:Transcript_25939/g.37191  ORF Transcript_25939/g.37191 Transcript_25939/m.37191 type:complete len:370 (-) Transcript_25939:89-1198(-)